MNPLRILYALLEDSSDQLRRACFALLYDSISNAKEFRKLMGHSVVIEFERLVKEVAGTDSVTMTKLKHDCREFWPEDVPAESRFVLGANNDAIDAGDDRLLLARAYDYLRGGLITDVTAVQIAVIIKAGEQGEPKVRTSDITTMLRTSGYKVPNPAALIRSLAERDDPVIEILDERVGARQELQFRLLPHAAEDLRRRILGANLAQVA